MKFPDTVLRTARLTLRAPTPGDIDAIVVAGRDPLTQQWIPLPDPYQRADAEAYVNQIAPATLAGGNGIVRAVEHHGVLAGVIDLKATDWRNLATEIGYWTSPAARGQGVMTEAVRALAAWALTEMKLERVVLRVAPGNAASIRVAEKAGFTFEGIARNAGFVHRGRVDLGIHSLIRADLP